MSETNNKEPEPWVRYWVFSRKITSTRPSDAVLSIGNVESVYLAAPVEVWATEVKELLQIVATMDLGIATTTGGMDYITELFGAVNSNRETAQRLLAHWPVKEGA